MPEALVWCLLEPILIPSWFIRGFFSLHASGASYFSKDPSQIGLGPALIASIKLSHLLNGPISKCKSPSEVVGVRTSTYELVGDGTVHSLIVCLLIRGKMFLWVQIPG